uniref:Uncharacterized protein n=1 Tax=Vitis vinifera TaxID=29760 RepID=A5BCN8_VITVI|nr:hypothetical protein VITISV_038873 [Vitis vinifera]
MGANVDKGEVEEMGRLKPKGGVRMSAQNKCSEGCGAKEPICHSQCNPTRGQTRPGLDGPKPSADRPIVHGLLMFRLVPWPLGLFSHAIVWANKGPMGQREQSDVEVFQRRRRFQSRESRVES